MAIRVRSPRGLSPLRRLAALCIVTLLAGCSSFKASTRLDVGPFAENTVGMIGEVQRATKPIVWIHLKKYDSVPAVIEARRAYAPARTLMRGVALYSTQIVSVYESSLPEERKAAELSRYLDEAVRRRLNDNPNAQQFLSPAKLDSAVTAVRHATDVLSALGAAQPVVSAALAYGNSIFDSIEVKIDVAGQDLAGRIEAEYAPVKLRLDELTRLQLNSTRAYTLLCQYRKGDDDALDSLRARDAESAAVLPAGKKPADATVDAVEKRILTEIDTHVHVRQELLQEFENYRAEQMELDELRLKSQEAARLGRITLILWARSHRNLAAGVTVPAAINVMAIVKNAASGASGLALP